MRNTKIVATLGPASDSPDCIRALLAAGVNVFRLNASHGEQADHARRVENIRAVAAEMDIHAAILLDLQGPKIRLGKFRNGGCQLETGSEFSITTTEVLGTPSLASTVYEPFARDVRTGDCVRLADGAVELKVLSTDGVTARCRVVSGGPIKDRQGINLPGVHVSAPSLTLKDESDLEFGVRMAVDFIALSFVRSADDPKYLRTRLRQLNAKTPIISKIEKPEGWENLGAILAESDGVMVARGDLGVEIALEKVPQIQKSIIERARYHGKIVITATQMLESMIENSHPTRAEVSDVANAIYDGSDALMLSGETAIGKFPVRTVETMARIAEQAESTRRFRFYKDIVAEEKSTYPEIIAQGAYHAASVAGVAGIAVFTSSGLSARLVSRLRPPVPIFAFTPSVEAARQLALSFGVTCVLVRPMVSTDEMLAQIDSIVLERGWLKPGDGVVSLAGQPVGLSGTTNMLKLHRVGESSGR
jgi:pyruvate kinase